MRSKTPLYKIVMLGDSGVGKTCLVCRLTNPNAVLNTDVPATMGIEFDTQLINTSVGTVKAQIWDTAGQERFARVLLPTYFRKAKGVLMVFDLTNIATLHSLQTRWSSQMRDNADDDDLVKVLIGNKCDIASDTDIQKQAKAFAATNSMEYIETSALTGTAVSTAFETLLNSVHLKAISDQRSGVKRGVAEADVIDLKATQGGKGEEAKGCC